MQAKHVFSEKLTETPWKRMVHRIVDVETSAVAKNSEIENPNVNEIKCISSFLTFALKF